MVTSVGVISSASAAAARTCQVTLQQQQATTHASHTGVKSDVSGGSSGAGTWRSISFRHVSSLSKEDVRRGKCSTYMREAACSGRLPVRNGAGAGVRCDSGLRFCAVYAISSWVGRTHLGASSSSSFGSSWAQLVDLTKVVEDAARRVSRRTVRRGNRGQGGGGALSAQASVFGVGAPEALVIGVVALLVFGPKGLAEVAKNLGKTLRSFQPTIQELRQVSDEFKNALEQEIGWDDVKNPNLPPAGGSVRRVPYESESTTPGGIGVETRPTAAGPTSTASQSSGGAASSLEGGDQGAMTITEEMKAASAREAWRVSAPPSGGQQDGPAT